MHPRSILKPPRLCCQVCQVRDTAVRQACGCAFVQAFEGYVEISRKALTALLARLLKLSCQTAGETARRQFVSDIALNATREDNMSGQRQFRFDPKRALPVACNMDRRGWRHHHKRPGRANGHGSTWRYDSTRICLLVSFRRRSRRPVSASAANRPFACRAADILEAMIDPEPLGARASFRLAFEAGKRCVSDVSLVGSLTADTGLATRLTSLPDGENAMPHALIGG